MFTGWLTVELSGPAKARSDYRAELAGSAPLACGLGRQRVVGQPGASGSLGGGKGSF